MARCAHPHYTIDLGVNENGKRNLKFIGFNPDLSSLKQLSERYGKSNIVPLPCGQCIQCRINKAKEWAVRCVLESLQHEHNYFITLTYDDAHLPKDGSLDRDELTRFFKRLRKAIGSFRYFGCGEYGSTTKRPHYHLILFGANIPDLLANNFHRLKSKLIDKLWPFGQYDIGEVNYASCNYVAQYTCKKVFKKEVLGSRSQEFICCSTKPGLGADWCKEHLAIIFEYDQVFGSFGSQKYARLPRYFDKLAELLDGDSYIELKRKRLDKDNAFEVNNMLVHALDNVEKLLEYEENITLNDFIRKKRGIRKL